MGWLDASQPGNRRTPHEIAAQYLVRRPSQRKAALQATLVFAGLRINRRIAMTPFFVQIKCELGKVLPGRQRAGRSRDRLRDLFDRRRLRFAGEILRRCRHRYRPFRQREGAVHSRHQGHPHHHHLQGVSDLIRPAPSASRRRASPSWRSRQITKSPAAAHDRRAEIDQRAPAVPQTASSRAAAPIASTNSQRAQLPMQRRSDSFRSERYARGRPGCQAQ